MKKVVRGICFAILLSLIMWETYRVLSWKDTTGGYQSSAQQLYHTDDNLIDVLFVGSSHCYNSVYPDCLWRDSGIAAFDLAISGQDKSSSYYSIVEALKTQSPKVVLVESSGLLHEGYGQEGNKYRNLLAYKNSADSLALAEEVDEENKWNYFLKWPIVHTRYRELGQYDFVQYEYSIYGRGAAIGWGIGPGPDLQAFAADEETVELSPENIEWLDRLIELSREEDFTLVFFLAPMMMYGPNQKIINAAAEYVREQGFDFLDFGKKAEELGLNPDTDFGDGNHCNGYGAEKITRYLGKYLSKHFDLTDHRNDEAYHLWDVSFHYYYRLEREKKLNETGEIGEYLSMALEDSELTVILALDGVTDTRSAELTLCMASLGISEEEYGQGGKWVWQEEQIVFSMDGADSQRYLLKLSDTETLKLENRAALYGERPVRDVMINRIEYGSDGGGLKVLVYDNFRKTVISVRQFY